MKIIRFINFIINLFAWLVVLLVINYLVSKLINIHDYVISSLVFYSIAFLLFIFYYSFFELKYQKTLGKFITKTKVVKMNGGKPDNSDIFSRTFFRLIPFDHFSFLIFKNGIHDFLSKTKVEKDK
ncbi:RDD family protein [Pseudofulvibacter geojedonensis]|uniref:RDD family protein n=1 Tax=Pseudofulvibacter geojedonensis TaxID=1123758 RepID=A0ABW3HY92_9FLAO